MPYPTQKRTDRYTIIVTAAVAHRMNQLFADSNNGVTFKNGLVRRNDQAREVTHYWASGLFDPVVYSRIRAATGSAQIDGSIWAFPDKHAQRALDHLGLEQYSG